MPKPISKTIIINGTPDADTLFGDNSGTLSNTGGKQTINGLGGDDALYGDAFVMQKRAHGGDDILTGGDGINDKLYGDAYEMHQNSVGVDGSLDGGVGFGDIAYGDAFLMDGSARGGSDILNGATLYGDAYEMHQNSVGGDDKLDDPVPGGNLLGDAAYMY